MLVAMIFIVLFPQIGRVGPSRSSVFATQEPPTGTETFLALKGSFQDLIAHRVPNWTRIGKVCYRKNSSIFILSANG